MRFKKGDRVRVIADWSCHDMPIGSEITILGFDDDEPNEYYKFLKEIGTQYYAISDGEVEAIERMYTQQECIDFAQHLLKDYSTIEVTQETLNNFLNKK